MNVMLKPVQFELNRDQMMASELSAPYQDQAANFLQVAHEDRVNLAMLQEANSLLADFHRTFGGVSTGDTIRDFVSPKSTTKQATESALELVRQPSLTKLQVEHACQHQAKSLVLGNYILMEKIGKGGMGQVYKARHRRMDRIVAVKLLPSGSSEDPAAIARFEREVKATAKISHPNVIAALDANCVNGIHFLVLEFIEGSDLSALVKRNGPYSLEKALDLILQAARGLEAAHAAGIIHRDIKPANLLLNNQGTVKVLDLGIARISEDGDGLLHTHRCCTEMVIGTVEFMAPEQALDIDAADARADIYSLGCSLFYLLTGKTIYQGDTVMKKLFAHREHPIPSLSAAGVVVPQQFESIFTKMVTKPVEDRYQTMSELIVALEQSACFC